MRSRTSIDAPTRTVASRSSSLNAGLCDTSGSRPVSERRPKPTSRNVSGPSVSVSEETARSLNAGGTAGSAERVSSPVSGSGHGPAHGA